ncbi:hypothetical protein SAMN05216344_110145 [Polaromonas sp. OV174]|uniref:hypothetical protein n=1 Tax=Polaromonas sp. OV174 TaxID=1855300 RepID=UPI0008E239FA|nr:hypothetical protein [Polaromonas sp. OV174]SFC18026.1 hypothetical protein SAMN05216344_110145 [Polaromonas sp. OV174]
MAGLQRITTEYLDVENRIRLAGELSSGLTCFDNASPRFASGWSVACVTARSWRALAWAAPVVYRDGL